MMPIKGEAMHAAGAPMTFHRRCQYSPGDDYYGDKADGVTLALASQKAAPISVRLADDDIAKCFIARFING